MKKFLLAAAFVTVCSMGSAFAQTAVQTEKAAVKTDVQQSDVAKEKSDAKTPACCAKKSKDAKACADKDAKASSSKAACCQHGHSDAKAEEKADANHKH